MVDQLIMICAGGFAGSRYTYWMSLSPVAIDRLLFDQPNQCSCMPDAASERCALPPEYVGLVTQFHVSTVEPAPPAPVGRASSIQIVSVDEVVGAVEVVEVVLEPELVPFDEVVEAGVVQCVAAAVPANLPVLSHVVAPS